MGRNRNGVHGKLTFSLSLVVGNGIVGVVNFLGTLPCFWFVSRFMPHACKTDGLNASFGLPRLIAGIDVGFWSLGPYLWQSL